MKKLIVYSLIGLIVAMNAQHAYASRLNTIGFEMNSITDGVECEIVAASGASTTTDAYSGNLAWSASTANGYCFIYIDYSSETTATTTVSMRFKYSSDGSSVTPLLEFGDTGISNVSNISLTTNDALRLRKADFTTVGSDFSILAYKNKWIVAQLQQGPTQIIGRVCVLQTPCKDSDFTTFASGTNSANAGVAIALAGLIGSSPAAALKWDDVKLNIATGASDSVDPQQSWPNDGYVAYIRPNGAGDSNQWQKSDGSAGSSTNWQEVDEVPVDDGTTLLESNTADDSDYYNMSSPTLQSSTTVNAINFNVRFVNESQPVFADFCQIQIQAKASTGGTATTSAAIDVADNSTWFTNHETAPILPPLTLYKDPDGNAWTTGTLQSMQAGILHVNEGCNQLPNVTALWAVVDYETRSTPGLIINVGKLNPNSGRIIINP